METSKRHPSSLPRLVLASRNAHKVEELSHLLAGIWDVEGVATLAPDLTWDETGTTFRDNALLKAQVVRRVTSDYVLSDDSGLQVDVLDGAPGVYSSSYGGTEGDAAASNAKLLKVLNGVPDEKRSAQFVCCLCLLTPSGEVHYFEGACPGRILTAPRGEGGFGYDPLFFVTEAKKGMAELTMPEKNSLSHRARAMQTFLQFKPV